MQPVNLIYGGQPAADEKRKTEPPKHMRVKKKIVDFNRSSSLEKINDPPDQKQKPEWQGWQGKQCPCCQQITIYFKHIEDNKNVRKCVGGCQREFNFCCASITQVTTIHGYYFHRVGCYKRQILDPLDSQMIEKLQQKNEDCEWCQYFNIIKQFNVIIPCQIPDYDEGDFLYKGSYLEAFRKIKSYHKKEYKESSIKTPTKEPTNCIYAYCRQEFNCLYTICANEHNACWNCLVRHIDQMLERQKTIKCVCQARVSSKLISDISGEEILQRCCIYDIVRYVENNIDLD